MAETSGVSWNSCKLVEEEENGELKLLTENLTQLMSKLNKPEFQDIPIVLLGIIGGKQSGKSFYTNLIAEYLKYDGKSWTKGMKEKGLKGFAFGDGEVRVSAEKVDGIFEPGDKERGGVNFWPELFLLEQCTGKKLLWIMHLYDGAGEQHISEGPVTNFVKVASSRLVDILWKDESAPEKLQESVESHPLSSNFCRSKVYLVRGSPANQPLPRDVNQTSSVIKISEFSKQIHDDKGIVNLQMKQLSVEKFIKAVMNDHDLQPATFRKDPNSRPTPLTVNFIENGLNWYVNLINSKKNGSSSSVAAQHQETSDLQHKAAASDLISKSSDYQSLENNHESKNNANIPTSSQSKSEVDPDSSQDTHEGHHLNAQDKILSKYDEEYYSSRNWKFLKKDLKTWIHHKLTCKSVGEMININEIAASIAGKVVDDLVRKGIPSEKAIKVVQTAKLEENILKFKAKIESLQGGLMKFCSEIDVMFQNTPYFPGSELTQNIEMIQNKIKPTLEDDDIGHLFDAGCKKLSPEYVDYNGKIESETKLLLESQQEIVRFYQEEMGQVLKSEKFQIPVNLQKIHDQLALELQRVFEDSIGKDQKLLDKLPLSKQLDKEFQTIRRKNVEKITSVQRRINNLIIQIKSDYEIEMDALLEANEDGIEPCVFGAEHEKAEIMVIKKFRELLVLEVRVGEHVDMYLKTLAAHVKKSQESFEEENEMNLKATKEKAMKCKTENERTAVNSQLTEPTRDQPLFFHLTYSKIGVSVSANSTENQDQDIIYVPAVVALTTKEEWVFGDDHVKAATENGVSRSWKIGEYFRTSPNHQPGRETASDEIDVGNGKLKITVQFLLAIFFANYKCKFEQQHKHIFSAAMIAVPFWFPSFQRQQILEAAGIAGFDSASLFNENSSAAYFMYSGGFIDYNTTNERKALIISENSNRVDMSVYSYNRNTGKLKMKANSGDYEEDLKKVSNAGGTENWPGIGVLITFLKAIANKISLKYAEENAVKKLTERLANMYTKSCEVVIFTETTGWLPLLGKVGEQVNPYAIQDNSRFAILGLASIFKAMQNYGSESGSIIEDGVPFYLNIYPPNGGIKTRHEMQRKADTLAKNPNYTVEATVKVAKGPYSVYQENSSWKILIGLLTIKNVRRECTHIRVSMKRTQDGIFELKKVEWLHKTTMTNLTTKTGEMEPEEFGWDANKMSTNRRNQYSFYLNSIYPDSGRLAKLKDLKEKAQKLEQAIAEGKGSFPSEMVKTLARKHIHEMGVFLEGSELSEEDVKQKSNILESMKRDYKLA